jgi:hypothetical protein
MNNGFLDDIAIAEPCSASWDDMSGDERVRFCGDCNLNVYNFSAMSRSEAEELVRTTAGRVCARLHRRADGTVLTRDCPVGLRRAVRLAWARTAALVGILWTGLLGCSGRKANETGKPPHAASPVQLPVKMGEACVPEPKVLMGKICPVPQPAPRPTPKQQR